MSETIRKCITYPVVAHHFTHITGVCDDSCVGIPAHMSLPHILTFVYSEYFTPHACI